MQDSKLHGLSSMATRLLLVELCRVWREAHGLGRDCVEFVSIGGVEAARRVRAGEPADVVVLAGDVIDALIDEGLLLKASRRELALSAVAVAVPAGTPLPDIASAQALRETLLAAPRIGYSTGPSGQALLRLFEQWQLSEVLGPRLVLAQPGVPVGRLLADGRVEIGFQQLSELQGMDGVAVVGVMPPGLEIVTSFVGAVSVHSRQPQAAQRLLDFMAAPATATLKQRYGMEAP